MSFIGLLFLSTEELRELTDLKIAKAQMRWLDKNKYPYEVSAIGRPKVLRSVVENRLQRLSKNINSAEPNFDAIR